VLILLSETAHERVMGLDMINRALPREDAMVESDGGGG
jgi:hypothetical protein